MATTATITPTLGSAPVTLQAGNYSAIDDRRFWGSGLGEGYLSTGSFQVIQRAAGANMTVDVASSVGEGAVVTGDSVTAQGKYFVPPTAANVNVDIAASDATNPRNDLVVLEVKDDQHDAGGLNLARVRVITGTPNASAALTDAPGANGTPALPSSCMPLAVVNVTAGSTTVVTARISDRRPAARPYSRLALATDTTGLNSVASHNVFQTANLSASNVTYAASRVLKATVSVNPNAPFGTAGMRYQLKRGSTIIKAWVLPSAVLPTAGGVDSVLSIPLTVTFNGPTAGATETFSLEFRSSNTTQVSDFADSTYTRTLTIEDLGPQ